MNLIKEELEHRYGATLIDPDNYRPSYYYHAFSLPLMPVVCSDDPSYIKLLKWGLIPPWTNNIDQANIVRYKTFNARSESIDSKTSFSTSFRTKRCIIPVRGFYEWQHIGNKKIPWYIYQAENEILSLAGIYDDWTETTTGEMFSTFSIVTTEANDLMAGIHNSGKRMPVVLNNFNERKWIDMSVSKSELSGLMAACPSEYLKAHTISPLINNRSVDRNTPEVIKPFQYQSENLLF